MATKVKDLAVSTGSYTDKNGDEKQRWLNVGSMMKNDDGGFFLIMDRTFNPAGLPNPDDRSNCIVSVFDAKPRENQQAQAPAHSGQPPASDGLNDYIPF